MQLATPPPPQPAVVISLQQTVGSAQSAMLGRYQENVAFDASLLFAHGGGEGHEGGLDVPYKLVKLKDNKVLHMTEEQKEDWEKKLKGEEFNAAEKGRDEFFGVLSILAVWSPFLYGVQRMRKERFTSERTSAIATLVLLACIPFNIIFSGVVYPDAEWEKIQELLCWFVVWSPAVVINFMIKIIDGLRQNSIPALPPGARDQV